MADGSQEVRGVDEKSRIADSALGLFASLGYDNTTTEMIADAAGVTAEEVVEAGGRRGLYFFLFERFYRDYQEMLDGVARDYTPDYRGSHLHLDRVIDIHLDHPSYISLWQQRWMSDAADIADIEERYWKPIFRRAAEFAGPVGARLPHYDMLASLIIWSLYGFLHGGIMLRDGSILGPDTVEGRDRFREYMHRLQDMFFMEDDVPGAGSGRDSSDPGAV